MGKNSQIFSELYGNLACYTLYMLDCIIRPAVLSDALGIAHIHVRTWQCAYKGQIPDSYLNNLSIEERASGWKKILSTVEKGNHALVAEHQNQIVGWCTFGKSRDEDVVDGRVALYGIYVDPQYIGMGIGSQLMETAMDTLRNDGYKEVTLWVLDTNEKSRKFYEKRGWIIEGQKKDDQRDGFILHEVRYMYTL